MTASCPVPWSQIFYRALRDVQPGEELTVWYSNSLAQWFDIPTIATPTHDEKGTASEKASWTGRLGEGPAFLWSLGESPDLEGLFLALCKTEFTLPVGLGRDYVTTT